MKKFLLNFAIFASRRSFAKANKMDLLTMKTAKGGRKISLPWFRQSSVQQSHAALSRQHTIDTSQLRNYPGSKKLQVTETSFKAFQFTHRNRTPDECLPLCVFSLRFGAENHHTKSIKQIIKFRRLNNFSFLSSLVSRNSLTGIFFSLFESITIARFFFHLFWLHFHS